jgi:hypothetical protein
VKDLSNLDLLSHGVGIIYVQKNNTQALWVVYIGLVKNEIYSYVKNVDVIGKPRLKLL